MVQHPDLIPYREFVQRVRRYRPSDLLPAIAANAFRFGDKAAWTADRVRFPWALAEAAKASIVAGNEFRNSGVSDEDVFYICAAYNALNDPLARGTDDDPSATVGAFLVRMSHQQFAVQQSLFEEMSRLGALFDGLDDLDTEMLDSALIERILGCTIPEFAGAGFVIAIGASNNAGFFDPAWQPLWDGPDSMNAHFPMATVDRVFRDHYLTDFAHFRDVAARWKQADETLRHHEFNPLVGRPFVVLPDGRYIAPQPHYAYQRLGPSALYYAGVESLDAEEAEAFTTDLGLVFQEYVGRQLRLLPGATVLPEIFYGNDQRSIDWFVVFDEFVLLVEAKLTRLSHLARMGGSALEADIQRSLGTAFRQVDRTERLIADSRAEFADIPIDRPRLGMVVTLEPYWWANSPFVRRLLPNPILPVTVASIREVEQFVDIVCAHGTPDVLSEVFADPERRLWNLANALPDQDVPNNPILQAAWDSYPFRDT